MRVYEVSSERSKICERILRSLPSWFGIEEATLKYIRDSETMPMFVAEDDGSIVGFLSLNFHNEYTAEIHVIGVLPEVHRKGAGRRLVVAAEEYLRHKSFEFLSVKTLSPARSDEGYEKTRKFYLSVGFRPVEEFKTLWGEDNPCLFLIKSLKLP